MFEQINEPIKVLASFSKGVITPHQFSWQHRLIKIAQINLVHPLKDGAVTHHVFFVSSATANYKITFNTVTLKWYLEQIYETT